jgi:integrase
MVEETTLSPHTINRRVNAIKSLVKASARRGAIPSTVAADFQLIETVRVRALRLRLKPHPPLLTAEQVRQLCRLPNPLTFAGLRDRALLFTLATSGCRQIRPAPSPKGARP